MDCLKFKNTETSGNGLAHPDFSSLPWWKRIRAAGFFTCDISTISYRYPIQNLINKRGKSNQIDRVLACVCLTETGSDRK